MHRFSACDAQIARVPTAWATTTVILQDMMMNVLLALVNTPYSLRDVLPGMGLLRPHDSNCLSWSNLSPLSVRVENKSKGCLMETTPDLSF